jgi:hypothetical protein
MSVYKFGAFTFTKTALFYMAEILPTEGSSETWNISKFIGSVAQCLPNL